MGAALVGVGLLLVTGALVARGLQARARPEAAFVAGLALLYLVALAHDALGVALRGGSVAVALGLCGGLAGAATWRRTRASSPAPGVADRSRTTTLAWAGVVTLALVLAWRFTLQPLTGFDTWFRWGRLAELALERQGLGFYPPRSADDYASYFFADGIPPLVSLSYWWLYALAGEVAPRATAALVWLQWAGCCALAGRIAARLGTPRAGAFAALSLALCPLFVRVVGMGQETGLIALTLLLAVHALLAEDGPPGRPALLVAGLAVGVAASAREYGGALLGPVLLLAWQRGAGARGALVLAATTVAVAGPWYLRTLLRTGDPLHGDLTLLQPDPVRAAILAELARRSSWAVDTGAKLLVAAKGLALAAPLQLLGLVASGRAVVRDLGPSVALVTLLWVASVPYTDGGVEYSLRVLAPALALLSVPAGLAADRALARTAGRPLVALVFAAWGAWTLACALAFPVRPQDVPAGGWARHVLATRPLLAPPELALRGEVTRALPPGERVLALNPYVSVALRDTGITVVPPWSPEVRALFEPGLSEAQVLERLRATRVRAYLHDPHHGAVEWLVGTPCGRAIASLAVPVAQSGDLVLVRFQVP